MSDSEGDGGPGRREVAHRLFATEYDDASLEYSESDEERAPNYVVTPTGARVNRLFVVGVLTAVEPVNDETVRARVVDPTGAFVIYAGQYQPDELAFFERTEPPTFVAVTGKANAFQPEDSDRVLTSVRPESVNEVDEDTRDRWVVSTAEQTIERIGAMAEALEGGQRGEALRTALIEAGYKPEIARAIDIALDHYDTTAEYLGELQSVATDAAGVVAGERDEVRSLDVAPADQTGSYDASVLAERLPRTAGVTTVPDEAATDDAAASTGAGTDTAAETGTETADTTADTDGAPVDAGASATAGLTEPAEEAATDPADTGAGGTPDPDDVAPATDSDAGSEAQTTGVTTEESADDDVRDAPSTATTGDADGSSTIDSSVSDEFEGSEDIGTTQSGSSLGNFDDGDDDGPESPPQTDEMYEFDEDEREQIEEEHGLEFSTGTEVDTAGTGEGDSSDAPSPGDDAGTGPDPDVDDSGDSGADEADVADPDEDVTDDQAAETAADEPSDSASGTDASIDDVLLDTMNDLDDGDGADRDAVIEAVIDATGVTADDVEEAIEDALMSGQCYEPDDDSLKPI